jgi:hypothetical protein
VCHELIMAQFTLLYNPCLCSGVLYYFTCMLAHVCAMSSTVSYVLTNPCFCAGVLLHLGDGPRFRHERSTLVMYSIIYDCVQVYYFTLGLAHVCAMSSTVSNPVLYGWLNTNLRKEFIKVRFALCAPKSQLYSCDNAKTGQC